MKGLVFLLAVMGSSVSAEPLRIATGGHFPPYIYAPTTPDARGFDKDLLDAICELGSFECEWVDLPMDDIFQALARGDIDVVAGGFGYSSARDELVDFTCTYSIKGDNTGTFIGTMPDQDLITARVGVLVSSLFQISMEQANRTTIPYSTEQGALEALSRGEIDVVFGSGNMVDMIAGADGFYELGTYPTFSGGTVLGVSEDAPELRRTLDRLLAEMSADGTLGQIQLEWLGRDEGDVIARCNDPLALT